MVEGLASEDVSLHAERRDDAFVYDPFAASGIERVPVWIEVVRMIAADLGVILGRSDAAKLVAALANLRKVNVSGVSAVIIKEDGTNLWLLKREVPRRSA